MRFETYVPCDALKPYVRMLAVSESGDESTYKVFPGTEVVIGFQYKGGLLHLEANIQKPLDTFGLTGILDGYRVFNNIRDTGTVLVYFREGGAAAFFREPAHEWFRQSVSLENFMLRSGLLLLEEQLQESPSDARKIALVEKFLLARLRQTKPDELVAAALAAIHRAGGNIRIAQLAGSLYISQGRLEKRFRSVVGTSPKKLASIVRMKHALAAYDPQRSLTELGYDTGFYDQAHFIREFRNFTGETPEKFFGP